MYSQFLSWRTFLAFVAILIVTGTIFYSKYLANKIALREKQKVEEWVEASTSIINPNNSDTRLPLKIIQDNDDIPIIWTNENDSIIDHKNLDSLKVISDKNYVQEKLRTLKAINDPITWKDPLDSTRINRYYYGHTRLMNEVQYYPLVQLFIVSLFIIVTIFALRGRYRAVQNQVWAGMAKETAHQLGTPISSLQGWIEMLKEEEKYTSIST
ncbi:MAG TPA: hypothetical protein VK588_00005, partial [Chitinophagaceae bacterium]|nr:hypothetical protein [Chitinophagaceae bacterium]